MWTRLVLVARLVLLLWAGLVDIGFGVAIIIAVVARLAIIAHVGLVAAARLALAVAPLIGFALQFPGRFTQHAGVMFRMLQKVFKGDAVVAQLGIARQHLIFLDDLLRRAAHLALWPRTVKHAVDDISQCPGAVRFRTRTLLG